MRVGNGWRAAPPAGGLGQAGWIAEFIEQLFPEADTTHFKGEICIRARSGQIAVLILELEVGPGVYDASGESSCRPAGVVEDTLAVSHSLLGCPPERAGGRGMTRRLEGDLHAKLDLAGGQPTHCGPSPAPGGRRFFDELKHSPHFCERRAAAQPSGRGLCLDRRFPQSRHTNWPPSRFPEGR